MQQEMIRQKHGYDDQAENDGESVGHGLPFKGLAIGIADVAWQRHEICFEFS